jgi:MerR family copper efflux transcriptional regulator
MHELRDMSTTLRHLTEHCQGDDRPHCPIIEELSNGHEAGPVKPERAKHSNDDTGRRHAV